MVVTPYMRCPGQTDPDKQSILGVVMGLGMGRTEMNMGFPSEVKKMSKLAVVMAALFCECIKSQ